MKKIRNFKNELLLLLLLFFPFSLRAKRNTRRRKNWKALNYRQVFSPSCVILCFGCVLNSSIMVYLVSRYF